MHKSTSGSRRKNTRARRVERRSRSSASVAVRKAPAARPLLERLLETPQLALAVPRLSPDVLNRIIQACGLEDCAGIVALATPEQVHRLFDLDLWRAGRPGRDEELDAGRFATWLGVLLEAGPAQAVEKLAGMDADLASAAFAQHIRVFDRATLIADETDDADDWDEQLHADGLTVEIGPYVVKARRTDAWDAIVGLLLFADAERPDFFHQLMSGCRTLSNAGWELDGLDDLLDPRGQTMFDAATSREARREGQGYVAAAPARAFLHAARQLDLRQDGMPPPGPVADAYFRELHATIAAPPQSPEMTVLGPSPSGSRHQPEDGAETDAIVDLLREMGVLPEPTRPLLTGTAEPSRQTRVEALVQRADETGAEAVSARTSELAYLANALLSGSSIQGRAFSVREASAAATAICNLGLENWPDRWRPADDLISVFQVGWTVLHQHVSMYAAERLIDVLGDLRTGDGDMQRELDMLRSEMTRHWRAGEPWRARGGLDAVMILDMTAWAALVGLIDECPVLHGTIGASRDSRIREVDASAFEFISENRQIASVRTFMDSLPELLR